MEIENEKLDEKTNPASYRIAGSTKQKFDKLIADSSSKNADEFFQLVISLFEKDNLKTKYASRAKEIEVFDSTMARLSAMFTNSLEVNKSTEEELITKYQALKEETESKIVEYRTSLADEKEKNKKHTEDKEVLLKRVEELTKNAEMFNSLKDNLEKQVKSFEEENHNLKLASHKHFTELEALRTQLQPLTDKVTSLSDENIKLSNTIKESTMRVEYQDKELNELKATVTELKEEKKSDKVELAKYHSRVEELLSKITDAEKEKSKLQNDTLSLQHEIVTLKAEKDKLMQEKTALEDSVKKHDENAFIRGAEYYQK